MNNDLLYQIALTLINGVGAVQAKQLIEQFGTAESIFKAKKKELSLLEGIGEIRAKQIKELSFVKSIIYNHYSSLIKIIRSVY